VELDDVAVSEKLLVEATSKSYAVVGDRPVIVTECAVVKVLLSGDDEP
jgi:hypothetical protein